MNKKYSLQILGTTWINVIGVFTAVFIYIMILTSLEMAYSLFQSIVATIISVVLYGMIFWITFIISLFVVDPLIMNATKFNLSTKLFIEWLIVSSPFFYGVFKYNEWIFLCGIIAFAGTQIVRKRIIKQISTLCGKKVSIVISEPFDWAYGQLKGLIVQNDDDGEAIVRVTIEITGKKFKSNLLKIKPRFADETFEHLFKNGYLTVNGALVDKNSENFDFVLIGSLSLN